VEARKTKIMMRADEIAEDTFGIGASAPDSNVQFNHFRVGNDALLLFATGISGVRGQSGC